MSSFSIFWMFKHSLGVVFASFFIVFYCNSLFPADYFSYFFWYPFWIVSINDIMWEFLVFFFIFYTSLFHRFYFYSYFMIFFLPILDNPILSSVATRLIYFYMMLLLDFLYFGAFFLFLALYLLIFWLCNVEKLWVSLPAENLVKFGLWRRCFLLS